MKQLIWLIKNVGKSFIKRYKKYQEPAICFGTSNVYRKDKRNLSWTPTCWLFLVRSEAIVSYRTGRIDMLLFNQMLLAVLWCMCDEWFSCRHHSFWRHCWKWCLIQLLRDVCLTVGMPLWSSSTIAIFHGVNNLLFVAVVGVWLNLVLTANGYIVGKTV